MNPKFRGLCSRRKFLASVGATAATLPFLKSLPSYAQAGGQPKLVLVFSANGRIRHLWGADGTPGQLMMRENLTPLQPNAQHLTVVEGIRNFGASEIGGTHEGGCLSLFTGSGQGLEKESSNAGFPSIDTLMMEQYKAESARPDSFYQQVVARLNPAREASPLNRFAFDMNGNRRDPFRSPWEAVEEYFAGFVTETPGGGPKSEVDPKELARGQMFEALNAQLGELESKLCSEDYYQMQGMRAAIAQAQSSVKKVVECELPTLPAKPNLQPWEPIWQPPEETINLESADSWYRQRGRLAADLLVLALACGVTRAGVLQFDQGASEATAVGHNDHHHNISHRVPQLNEFVKTLPPIPPDYDRVEDVQANPPQDMLNTYGPQWALLSDWEKYYAEEFNYLVTQLNQFGVLEDTLVVWGSELDDGQHKHYNMPFVLASGSKIPVKRGQVVQLPISYDDNRVDTTGPARSHNDFLKTVLHAVGVEQAQLGVPAHNQGLIDELLA